VGGHPLRPPSRRRLGELLPHQPADGPQPPPSPLTTVFLAEPLTSTSVRGISPSFDRLSPGEGQVSYVLLTRAPLAPDHANIVRFAFDLHVLGTPPAFILSQDQTLRRRVCLCLRLKRDGLCLTCCLGRCVQGMFTYPGQVCCSYHSLIGKVLAQTKNRLRSRHRQSREGLALAASCYVSCAWFVV
jgi:hypothetical protein